jgi:mRNA interferase MazF
VILSHDGFNETPHWRSIIVVPCSTSKSQQGRGPTVVFLKEGSGGLPADCVAVCHQITTLDRSKLTQRLGSLLPQELRAVEMGIRAAIDLDS